jgi:hypothetical protein
MKKRKHIKIRKKLRLRTRHMPTKVHENEDGRRYNRKKKHKKQIDID